MNEPARPASGDIEAPGSTAWVASLPPPPFVVKPADGSPPRFVPLSPRVVILVAAAIVVGLLLWMARDSVRPFIVGLLLVYLLDMPVRWLVRRGLRRSLAIMLVYIATFLIVVEFLALTLTPLVNEILQFIEDFPELAESLNARLQDLTELYSRLEIPVAIREWIDGVIAGMGQGPEVGAGVDLSFLLPLVTGAGSLIGAIFGYIILPVWVFYLLKDRVGLATSFDRALPAAWRFDTMVVLRSVERVLSQWVRAQFVLGLTVGVFTFIGLLVLSRFVDPIFGRYALLLSVTAGILELLPIIGPIIAAVPAVLLAATAGPESVIAALILYTLVQQVENNLLVPKIQGDAVQLHPAAVMFAIIIGGALGGLVGAILALPVAAAGRDVVRYLFRRAGPDDDPASLAAIVRGVGMAPVQAVEEPTSTGPGLASGDVGAADA